MHERVLDKNSLCARAKKRHERLHNFKTQQGGTSVKKYWEKFVSANEARPRASFGAKVGSLEKDKLIVYMRIMSI